MKKTLLISTLLALAPVHSKASEFIESQGVSAGVGIVKINGLKTHNYTIEYDVTLTNGIHLAAGFSPSSSASNSHYQEISPFQSSSVKTLDESMKIKSNWNAHVGYQINFDGFGLTPYIGVSQFDAEYERIDFVNNIKTHEKGSESVMYYGARAKFDSHPITYSVRAFESSDIKHFDVDRSVMFALGFGF